MKNPKKIKKNDIMPYLLSFIIPTVIMGIAFFNLGIYPGGKMTLLTYDLKALFLALYGYISEPGAGYDNILHSMSGALGGNYYSTFVLCISPTDLIFKFVPVKYIPEVLYFIVLAKVGLCGLTCSVFLKKNQKFTLPGYMVVVLACCYALMSYNFMYYMAPMWYDAIILLPLISLNLERIISGRKSPAFIGLMSLCIICDYYIAFMSIIALIIYVIFRLSEDNTDLSVAGKRFVSFAVHGIISAGISMFVLLPSVLDFERGKLSEGVSGVTGDMFKNSLLDVILSFKPQSYAGVDFNASPNIFCGSLVTVLTLFWLIYGKKELKSRIAALILITFYFLSFIIGPLDRAWHGFREPVCFSVRYAYTFVFFMICFAARGYSRITELKVASSSAFGLFRFLFIAYTFVEILLNGSYILAGIGTECGYSLSSEYKKICDVQENLVPYDELSHPESYGRVVANYKYSNFDGSLFGYDGISRFCSSYNFKTHMFFRSMGLNSIYHSLGEKGMTPPLASLIGARYILSYWVDLSEMYDPIKKFDVYTLYENNSALPLAYEVNAKCVSIDSEFSDDPFANLNTVYGELFTDDGEVELFVPVEVNRLSDELEYSFTTGTPGRYYMYVEYKYDDVDTLDDYEGDWEYMHKRVARNYTLDGTDTGEYGNNQYSYCVDLGLLEGDREYFLSLESTAAEEGKVYICYYDDAAYERILSSVNGAKLIDIGKKGIVMEASVNGDSELLITLPYEKGYSVYVDGVKTEYGSYRDCIMLIPLKSGDHEIVIKYFPPGLKTGIIISIVSLFAFAFYGTIGRRKVTDD